MGHADVHQQVILAGRCAPTLGIELEVRLREADVLVTASVVDVRMLEDCDVERVLAFDLCHHAIAGGYDEVESGWRRHLAQPALVIAHGRRGSGGHPIEQVTWNVPALRRHEPPLSPRRAPPDRTFAQFDVDVGAVAIVGIDGVRIVRVEPEGDAARRRCRAWSRGHVALGFAADDRPVASVVADENTDPMIRNGHEPLENPPAVFDPLFGDFDDGAHPFAYGDRNRDPDFLEERDDPANPAARVVPAVVLAAFLVPLDPLLLAFFVLAGLPSTLFGVRHESPPRVSASSSSLVRGVRPTSSDRTQFGR